MEERPSQCKHKRKEKEINMNAKCYDCVYCSVDKKYNQTCTVLQKDYAHHMGRKQICNFFKTHSQDEAIKRACAKRLVAIGMLKTEDEYLARNRRIAYQPIPKESDNDA